MDISELLPILAAALISVLAAAACWRLRGVSRRPVRIGLLLVTGALSLVSLAVAAATFWFDTAYTRRLPPMLSPDGRHRALVSYTVNTGSAMDVAEVSIRSASSPLSHRVYLGPSHFDANAQPPEPQVEWIDDSHLRIAFHTYVRTEGAISSQGCAASADGVTIVCEQDRVHAVK